MEKEKPSSPCEVQSACVFPLPIALYESNGLIFELYRGGRPYQPLVIHWERVKTVTVSRDDHDFDVDINQGQQKPQP